jgi:hypothetical protein
VTRPASSMVIRLSVFSAKQRHFISAEGFVTILEFGNRRARSGGWDRAP